MFTFFLNTLFLATILFTWLKFTCLHVRSQKRVSVNQPLSTFGKHLLLSVPLKIYNTKIPRGVVVQAMDFAASTSGFEACLSHLIYLESNAVILYKFWRPQPTLPWLALQYSISTNTRTMGSLSSMQGSFANSWLRKQTWRNQKEGRVGCLHQNILTREVIDLPPTFAIIIHIPRSCIWRPACPPHTS